MTSSDTPETSNTPPVPHIIGGATSRTMRAHWAAIELNIDYTYELIGSRTGATQKADFLALNPKEKIPVLQHGPLVLTESAAIMNYLGRLGGGLLPTTTQDWAVYEEWQSFILMELDAQCLYIMRKHRDLPAIYGDAPVAVETAREGFKKQIKIADRRLATHPFLLGDAMTGVDILLTTCLEWARSYGFDLSDEAQTFLRRIRNRAAYQKARDLNFSIQPGA